MFHPYEKIAKLLDVYALRLDYGFDHAEMLALAKEMADCTKRFNYTC